MDLDTTGLDPSWHDLIDAEVQKPYMRSIMKVLDREPAFYPARADILRALKLTALNDVKVVILGQDPYHGEGQATGLAFAVEEGVSLPPSLRNIFKELAHEYPGFRVARDESGKHIGRLDGWARQGVLLLNTSLTVRPGAAGSHSSIGWDIMTGKIVERVSQEREGVVFILWGAHAQKRRHLIDETKHTVIASAHPSPLSARRGFFGSDCFKKANDALEAAGMGAIDWSRTTDGGSADTNS